MYKIEINKCLVTSRNIVGEMPRGRQKNQFFFPFVSQNVVTCFYLTTSLLLTLGKHLFTILPQSATKNKSVFCFSEYFNLEQSEVRYLHDLENPFFSQMVYCKRTGNGEEIYVLI